MKIYTSLTIGEFHTNYCEDFLINEQIATNQRVVAVLDGCTMGKESVFASILYGKVLRNVVKNMFYEEFISEKSSALHLKLKEVLRVLFSEIKLIKNQLGLEINELLSTLIIGIIDIKTAEAEFLTIGDGMIIQDGKITEYEQDNTPDYLAYHLTKNFDDWYKSQKQKLSIVDFKDLSICTDGIFTFKNFQKKEKQKTELEIIEFLLIDNEGSKFDNFLERKVRQLKNERNHVVTDDLAIIRIKRIM